MIENLKRLFTKRKKTIVLLCNYQMNLEILAERLDCKLFSFLNNAPPGFSKEDALGYPAAFYIKFLEQNFGPAVIYEDIEPFLASIPGKKKEVEKVLNSFLESEPFEPIILVLKESSLLKLFKENNERVVIWGEL